MESYKVMAEYRENGVVKEIGPFETEEEAWKKLDKLAKKADNKEEFESKCFIVLYQE
jgi:hypothetical protein